MPNGKPGDHPLTDMLVHGRHPFPADIEERLRRVLAVDPGFPDGKRPYVEQIEWEQRLFAWEQGEGIEEGRQALDRLIIELENRAT